MITFKTFAQKETHFSVKRLLEKNPDLTLRELARELGLSLGSINYCLKAMIDKGLLKMKNFAHSKNKFGYMYALTLSGISEIAMITHCFSRKNVDEHEALKVEIKILKSKLGKDQTDDLRKQAR